MKPICYDMYAGLGGFSSGFLAEGFECIGFDLEAHDYGTGGYPGELRIRDVLTIHGSELKDAACLIGSSPCQEFSYRAMPWSRAKALPPPDLGMELFNAQFRIQREACEAAGRYIPMIVENVRGAQKWVGRAKANYGSYFLWGDVGMVGRRVVVVVNGRILGRGIVPIKGAKMPSHPREDFGWNHSIDFQESRKSDAVKFSQSGDVWFDGKPRDKMLGEKGPAAYGSKSNSRKTASAMIAKIPFALSQHVAQCLKLVTQE